MRVLNFCVLTAIVSLSGTVFGNGLFDNGTGARSRGVAGADTAWSDSVLSAMHNNPANLDTVTSRLLELGGAGGIASGESATPLATNLRCGALSARGRRRRLECGSVHSGLWA